MKTSKEGEPLHKVVRVRIFNPGNKTAITKRFVAAPGTGYTERAIRKMLYAVAEEIQRNRPDEVYECVCIGPSHFNFVWRGKDAPDASHEPAEA